MRSLAFLLALLLVLSVALVPSALATDPYYSEWVYAGDTFTVDGTLFSLEKGNDPFQVLLQKGTEKYVLNYGECKISNDRLEKYCYAESDYVDCMKGSYDCAVSEGEPADWCCPYDVDHIHYEAGSAVWGSYLEFTKNEPVMEITHEAEQSVLKLGEQTSVTLTFTNTGEDVVSNGKYKEYVPAGFKIVNAPDFTRSGNILLLNLNVGTGLVKKYRYTIKPIDYVTDTIKGNLTYTYEGEEEKVSPSPLSVSVPSPFLVEHGFEPNSAKINDEVAYTYTLTNNDGSFDMDARVDFGADLLDLIDEEDLPSGVRKINGIYVWEDTLDKNEKVELEFPFRTTHTGTSYAEANATMEVNGEQFELALQDVLTVSATKLAPEIRFSTAQLEPAQEFTVRIVLDNLDGETTYRNIKGFFGGDILDKPRILAVDRVVPGEAPLIGEFVLTAPSPDKPETLAFWLNGTYETSHDEQFSFAASNTIGVSELVEPYVITQTINATSLRPGDTAEVTVNVKNQHGRYAEVTVTDMLPSGALVVGGSREKEMSLNDDEQREAYTYQVTVPESWQSPVFTITTRVFDHQDETYYDKGVNLTVDVPIPVQTPVNESPTPKDTEVKKVEKKGFFTKIVDAIVDFVVGLFS